MNQRKPFIVKSVSIADATAHLPPPKQLEGSLPPIDLFIGAAGFEERVLAVPRHFVNHNIKIVGKCLLGRYRTNVEDNSAREEELRPLLCGLGGELAFFDADSPVATKNAIDTCLAAAQDATQKHVVFDICGASSRLIFSVMAALHGANEELRLTVLYAPASKYHEPTPDQRDKPVLDWGEQELREYGVAEVDYNELYQGMHQDHLPGFVIVFPSMFSARLQRCLSHLGVGQLSGSDDNVFWVLPSTDEEEHLWRGEKIQNSLSTFFCDECSGEDHPKLMPEGSYTVCDVFDYAEAAKIVMEQIESKDSVNISLIHMGTKLQAIGASIALASRPEVALVGARPTSFSAKNYSQGYGQIVSIVFESQKISPNLLAEIGAIEVIV